MDASIKMIRGRNVVYIEVNKCAKWRGDQYNGAPGGTKRTWKQQRKPKNRETARQL